MGQDVHDVVIIGGGIIGLSTARFAARAGLDVCVVERGFIGGESSGRCAGGIGQSHRKPVELPIAMRAVEIWRELSATADIDFEYRQHGNLRPAFNDTDVQIMTAMVERERAGGLDCRWLGVEETRDMAPYLAEGSYLGSVHTPSDGSAEPYLACVAMGRSAVQHGATIYEHREVQEIMARNGKATGVRTPQGPIAAGIVVNAANAWAAQIDSPAKPDVALQVCRSHILVTEELPHFVGPFTSCNRFGYFRQSVTGNVLIGFQSQPVEHYEQRTKYEAIETATRRISTLAPRLRNVSIIRAFTGFTVWSPDYLPIIGRLNEAEGLIVAALFSGLGFAIGPAVGEMIAGLIQGKPHPLLDHFDPYRFVGQERPAGFSSSWQGI
jgi:sarcosine oxidase subunit beta